jgi:predicted Zn-dependent protease
MNISSFRLNKLIIGVGVLSVCTFCGCASLGTYNPATGRNEFIFISTPEEISLGNDVHQNLKKEFKFSDGSKEAERLRRIGQRVAKVSDRQDYTYRFFLIEKDEMNAFTTPGGNIYVFSGLMDKLTTDAQIASVLAHEVGHCAARHTVKKYQAALGYNLIGSLALGQIGGEKAREITSMSSNVVMNLVFSAYGRKDEYESDHLAVKYLRMAEYDLEAMIETLEVLERESEGAGAPLVLRSHPYLSDRIKAVREEISPASSQQAQ